MAFPARLFDEMITIAAAGGGFVLDARGIHTSQLIQLAKAAGNKGARIELHGVSSRSTQELVQIAAAGGGSVMFGS